MTKLEKLYTSIKNLEELGLELTPEMLLECDKLYEYWLGSALLRVADEDFVSEKTEDKERAVEEQMEGLEHLLEYHKSHYLEMGSEHPMDISNSIAERLRLIGKNDEVVQHYKRIAELTANADDIEIGTRKMYVKMHADALKHLSDEFKDSSPRKRKK